MDWARDNAFIGYGGPDPRKVFRYQARTSIVVKITAKNDVNTPAFSSQIDH
jgi:hypothetical protein